MSLLDSFFSNPALFTNGSHLGTLPGVNQAVSVDTGLAQLDFSITNNVKLLDSLNLANYLPTSDPTVQTTLNAATDPAVQQLIALKTSPGATPPAQAAITSIGVNIPLTLPFNLQGANETLTSNTSPLLAALFGLPAPVQPAMPTTPPAVPATPPAVSTTPPANNEVVPGLVTPGQGVLGGLLGNTDPLTGIIIPGMGPYSGFFGFGHEAFVLNQKPVTPQTPQTPQTSPTPQTPATPPTTTPTPASDPWGIGGLGNVLIDPLFGIGGGMDGIGSQINFFPIPNFGGFGGLGGFGGFDGFGGFGGFSGFGGFGGFGLNQAQSFLGFQNTALQGYSPVSLTGGTMSEFSTMTRLLQATAGGTSTLS